MKTKRHLQQSSSLVAKKKPSNPRPTKKKRIAHIPDVLRFPIDDTFRVVSKRKINDCVICTLEFLGIITPQLAELLRTIMGDGGLHLNQILAILRYQFGNNVYPKVVSGHLIIDMIDLLQPSQAVIVILASSTGGYNHMVVVAKDLAGRVCIVDPQIEYICVEDDCLPYMQEFSQDEVLTFTSS